MAIYYFDTSALLKRYVDEPGSNWIRQLCTASDADGERVHILLVGNITTVEVAAALSILERRKIVPKGIAERAYRKFVADLPTEYQITEINSSLLSVAAELALHHPLKANDAVQLALALAAQKILQESDLELILLSGDAQLLQAARKEYLASDNPFEHTELDNSPTK